MQYYFIIPLTPETMVDISLYAIPTVVCKSPSSESYFVKKMASKLFYLKIISKFIFVIYII